MKKIGKLKALNTHGASHLLALLLVIVGLGIVGSYKIVTSHADATRTANVPVIYVHGYLLNTCPGGDSSRPAVFGNEAALLKQQGYTGSADYIDYYACDRNGSSIANSGTPNTYYPGGEMYKNGLNPVYNPGGATNKTDIRHISYQLAWYIYDKYSSKGQPVSVVSHSMGGLISAWMLYQIQSHNSLFPPYLYVQDSVTISTPFQGVNDGYNNISWCPSSTQCTQVKPGSEFITALQAGGMNYQATNGTDWTALGGAPCDTVDAPDGTTLAAGNAHIVWYYAKRGSTPNCYSHTSYLTDTVTTLNMPAKLKNPGDVSFTTVSNAPHSLLAVAQALMSGAK